MLYQCNFLFIFAFEEIKRIGMGMDTQGAFSAFRLRRDTVRYLQELKRAFEVSYERSFTNDEFIRQIAASVEEGDVAVWDIFCQMQEDRRRLEEMARSRRRRP